MNNQDFLKTLLEREKHWEQAYNSAKEALEATRALIAIEQGGAISTKASTQTSTPSLGKSRKDMVMDALEAIGTGTVNEVATKMTEQVGGLSFDKAKSMARPELSILKAKDKVGYEKIENSLSYRYKYIG